MNQILDNLEFQLKHGILKDEYFKTSNSYEDRTKLRLSTKKEINKIEKLKKQLKTMISYSMLKLKFLNY